MERERERELIRERKGKWEEGSATDTTVFIVDPIVNKNIYIYLKKC